MVHVVGICTTFAMKSYRWWWCVQWGFSLLPNHRGWILECLLSFFGPESSAALFCPVRISIKGWHRTSWWGIKRSEEFILNSWACLRQFHSRKMQVSSGVPDFGFGWPRWIRWSWERWGKQSREKKSCFCLWRRDPTFLCGKTPHQLYSYVVDPAWHIWSKMVEFRHSYFPL